MHDRHELAAPLQIWTTPEAVIRATRQAALQITLLCQDVSKAVAHAQPSLHSIIEPLVQLDNTYSLHKSALTFHGELADGQEKMDHTAVVADSKKALDDARLPLIQSTSLLKALKESLQCEREADLETRKFMSYYIQLCEKAVSTSDGDATHQRLQTIDQRVKLLKTQCKGNTRNNDESLVIDAEALRGLPADAIAALKDGPEKGQKRLEFSDSTHDDMIEQVASRAIKAKWHIAKRNRCMSNLPLLHELVVLRAEAASLQGYPDHASRVLKEEDAMAESPDAALAMLQDAQSRLVRSASLEKEGFVVRKKAELDSTSGSEDGLFYYWDYYLDDGDTTTGDFDRAKFYEYFQAESTLAILLTTFGEIFGLSFEQRPNPLRAICDRDMPLYVATDLYNHEFMGYLFVDLYGGAFCNDCIQPGFVRPDGTRHRPTVVLSCDFSTPSAEKPGLLTHFELIMLCHEMGHSFHDLVSKTRYARFHGTRTTVDFAEGISQTFEKFAYDKRFLKHIGRHYSYHSASWADLWKADDPVSRGQQPPERISDQLMDRFLAVKSSFGSALFWLEQIQMAMFDLQTHRLKYVGADTSIDLTREFNSLQHDVGLFDMPPNEECMNRSFLTWNHIVENYDARYYSYIYSNIMAVEIYETSFRADPFDSEQGHRIRRVLMEKGGSEDSKVLWHNFTGRDLLSGACAHSIVAQIT